MKNISLLIIGALLTVASSNVEGALWDGGYHEFSEGFEGEIEMINGATADITGGEIGFILSYDSCGLNIYDDSVIGLVKPYDTSSVYVYGGEINVIFTRGLSTTNIYGGLINEINATDLSTLNLYVKSYEYDPTGGDFYAGLLTGTWNNNNAFSIDLRTADTMNHINFIPEPCTIYLLAIGGLALRRSKGNIKR